MAGAEQAGGNTTHTGSARLLAWADVGANTTIGPTSRLFTTTSNGSRTSPALSHPRRHPAQGAQLNLPALAAWQGSATGPGRDPRGCKPSGPMATVIELRHRCGGPEGGDAPVDLEDGVMLLQQPRSDPVRTSMTQSPQ